MTKDEIEKLAVEAGWPLFAIQMLAGTEDEKRLERFAALVAKAEREECAKVCQARSETPFPQTPRGLGFSFSEAWRAARGAEELCAAAIRARGNA